MKSPWRLWLAVFVSGAVLMALEVLAFLINARTFGAAWRETTAVIGVFLVAMSSGYWLGGRLGDRRPQLSTLAASAALAALAVGLVPAIEPAISGAVFTSALPLRIHSLCASLLVYFVPVLLLSMSSPIAARLAISGAGTSGSTTGAILAISTAGSLAGTLAAGFWLIDTFTVSGIIRALAGAMLALSLLLALSARAAPALALVLLFVCGVPHAQPRQVWEKQTPYHHVVVLDENGIRRLELNKRSQSTMSLADPLAGAYEYTDYVWCAWLFKRDIRRVLLIGLGGGSVPKRLLHDHPDLHIEVSEIDAGVEDAARRFFFLKQDPRLRVDIGDGRLYLKRQAGPYDLIVVDAYSANRYGLSVPRHMVTQEFLREVHARLAPDGVLVYNIASNSNRSDSAMNRALQKTVATVFPVSYSFDVEQTVNTMLVAPRAGRRVPVKMLQVQAASLIRDGVVKLPGLAQRVQRLHLQAYDTKDVPLLTDEFAPVEKLMLMD